MTVLLLGDSNLARLYHGLPDLVPPTFGASVECRAVEGAWSGSWGPGRRAESVGL
jgi:hypothetical protein